MRHPRSPIPRPALVAAPVTACPGGGLLAQETSVAQDPGAPTIDERVDQVFAGSTGWFVDLMFAPLPFTVLGVEVPWIVAWLVVGACVFTWRFRFVQFRAFGHAIALVRGDHADPRDMGELSRFQALATALSGTVGLGSIAGVAVAVSIGGPGATFWMILAGLLGMASKFAECTLGVKYRNEYPDGTVSGGPMYYMAKGFRERGAPGGRLLAALFSIFCIGGALGAGNMFQANQLHAQLVNVTGGEASLLSGNGWITGFALAALVFAVIVGGVKSIARVAERIVPFMGLLYVGTGLVVVLLNHDRVGWALGQIALGAFTGLGVAGGAVGALVQGFRRAAFSNEAGVGSSAIAHAAVRTREPVTQGAVALLEPFVDTVVICTVTALVIVISGVLTVDPATGLYVVGEDGAIRTPGGASGVELTSLAFAEGLPWFPYVLAVAVTLFAFSTMISWSYYGLKAWTYLLGEGRAKELVFKLIFCAFVVVGAAAQLEAVIDFSDAMVLAMAVLNFVALYVLLPIVGEDVRSYFARLRSGEIRKPRRRTAPD